MVLSSFNREVYERDLRAEGRVEGEIIKLIQMVCKKLQKNKSPNLIAQELEEELPLIEKICKAANECGSDYDCDQIYGLLVKENFR